MSNDKSNGGVTATRNFWQRIPILLEEEEGRKKKKKKRRRKRGRRCRRRRGKIETSNIPFGARRLVKRRKVVNNGAGAFVRGGGTRRRTTRKRLRKCEHPAFMFGICVHCGQERRRCTMRRRRRRRRKRGAANAETAVRYLHEGLTVSDKLLRERRTGENGDVESGKLFLVLDLDHTLLNSLVRRVERQRESRWRGRRGRRRTS